MEDYPRGAARICLGSPIPSGHTRAMRCPDLTQGMRCQVLAARDRSSNQQGMHLPTRALIFRRTALKTMSRTDTAFAASANPCVVDQGHSMELGRRRLFPKRNSAVAVATTQVLPSRSCSMGIAPPPNFSPHASDMPCPPLTKT
eukprot:2016401-Rhodomonas_salina.2